MIIKKGYDLKKSMKEFFGFSGFKGNQEAVIGSLLHGNDTFVIMPTGGGKSLCYQLPALMCDGTAIIISPLIALMKNQVDSMRNYSTDRNVSHFLNSSLTKLEILEVKEDITKGCTKLLYVAPETLTKEENVEFFRSINVSFYAIDESHCISEWGHDFRPEYRRIRPIIDNIGHKVPVIALTATATPKVQHDIQKNLNIMDAQVFKSSFNRANLYYEVRHKDDNVFKEIVKYIKGNTGKSGIVYCLSRNKVEELSEFLCVNGIKSLPYHAGLDATVRRETQDKFLMEEIDVIVATIAFGMGIDKPDVRFVIHHDIPKSLEGYYQETGRAGRDDGEGNCVAFYSVNDLDKLEKFLKNKPVAEQEIARQLLAETASYAESSLCRRKQLLHYFGEVYHNDNCGCCDNCLHPKQKIDSQEYILMVLEAVISVKQQFKSKYIVNILLGKSNINVKNARHHELEIFGKGSDHDERFWNVIVRQAQLSGFIYQEIENYGVLKLSEAGKEYFEEPTPVMITVDVDFDSDDSDDAYGGGGAKVSVTDTALFSMLKDLRKEISRKENLPPYIIFQDPSLEDMAIQYPITFEEMKQITGVGVGKAQKYGQPFIDLIKHYVEDNEIMRPNDMIVKSVINKSGLKVFIIQSIDRKISLHDIALTKDITLDQLLTEIESIVSSGTKIDINYFIDEEIEEYHQEEIYEYFSESETDSIEQAWKDLGEDEYSEDEIRLMRIKYLSDVGN